MDCRGSNEGTEISRLNWFNPEPKNYWSWNNWKLKPSASDEQEGFHSSISEIFFFIFFVCASRFWLHQQSSSAEEAHAIPLAIHIRNGRGEAHWAGADETRIFRQRNSSIKSSSRASWQIWETRDARLLRRTHLPLFSSILFVLFLLHLILSSFLPDDSFGQQKFPEGSPLAFAVCQQNKPIPIFISKEDPKSNFLGMALPTLFHTFMRRYCFVITISIKKQQ